MDNSLARSPLHGHIIFGIVSLVLMCGLSGMLATRLKVLDPQQYRILTLLRVLTILAYITALLFLFAAGLLLSAWDLSSQHACYVGIELCLSFYVTSKIILYLFLLERAIMIRPHRRTSDPIYLLGLLLIFLGLGTIATLALLNPIAALSPTDHICRIGLPAPALIALLTYDTTLNLALTATYIHLTNSLTRNLTFSAIVRVAFAALPFRTYGPLTTQASMLQLMMAKSVLAALALVGVTGVNLAVLIEVRGHEQGWLCLTVCCVDVAWSVVVIHWLTSNPLVDYGDGDLELGFVRAAPVAPVTPRALVGNSVAHRFFMDV